jgi:hypothetical protein
MDFKSSVEHLRNLNITASALQWARLMECFFHHRFSQVSREAQDKIASASNPYLKETRTPNPRIKHVSTSANIIDTQDKKGKVDRPKPQPFLILIPSDSVYEQLSLYMLYVLLADSSRMEIVPRLLVDLSF